MLGSKFREAALLNCSEGAREGILDLSDRLRNVCFVQGLSSDRIQTIVTSRNYRDFDEIAETALLEESAIVKRTDSANNFTCYHCGEKGHISRNCKKPPKKRKNFSNRKPSGNETGLLECSRPTVSSTH
jgi:hypothetical protein